MSLVYFHQPEELAPGLNTPIDDDSSWWAGAQRCFATAAAAAILAGSTLAATLDRNLQRQTDDVVPQPVAQAVDEDCWQNSTQPVPATLWQPLPINFDAGELAPGAVPTAFEDEGFAPPRPIAAPSLFLCKPAGDDDAPQFTAPSFAPDEDYLETRQYRVSSAVFRTAPAQQNEGPAIVSAFEEDAAPRIVIWLKPDRRDATLWRLYLGDPVDLSRSSGPGVILARGAVSAAPAHAPASSTNIAHTLAESAAAAHTCAAAAYLPTTMAAGSAADAMCPCRTDLCSR